MAKEKECRKSALPTRSQGTPRVRRSHRFIGDKNEELLRRALHASLMLTDDDKALVRIINDRVGHSLPAGGMNSLVVRVAVRAGDGRTVEEVERAFGSKEWIPGYLDFWPFRQITKIPYAHPTTRNRYPRRLPSGSRPSACRRCRRSTVLRLPRPGGR